MPWPFALRWTLAAAQVLGQASSSCSRTLFGQSLAALCREAGTLPQSIQVNQPGHGVPSPPSGCSIEAVGVPRRSGDRGLGSSHPARSQVWGSALTTAAGRQLLGQATVLLPLLLELLAVLQQEGPSTKGIFHRAASRTVFWELWEALACDADIDLGSQPVLLLAIILKVSASDPQLKELLAGLAQMEPLALQDFLRSIPSKLLVNNLYEDWMAAMQKTSKEEKT